MIKDESVRTLFAEYEKAFDALDLSTSAGFFADNSLELWGWHGKKVQDLIHL
jgi:hypothetical protein